MSTHAILDSHDHAACAVDDMHSAETMSALRKFMSAADLSEPTTTRPLFARTNERPLADHAEDVLNGGKSAVPARLPGP
jgi:hypothetical protein